MLTVDENLRHGAAPTRFGDHFLLELFVVRDVNFLKILALALQQFLRADTIRAVIFAVDDDVGHTPSIRNTYFIEGNRLKNNPDKGACKLGGL
jgi:hypothetical protein